MDEYISSFDRAYLLVALLTLRDAMASGEGMSVETWQVLNEAGCAPYDVEEVDTLIHRFSQAEGELNL